MLRIYLEKKYIKLYLIIVICYIKKIVSILRIIFAIYDVVKSHCSFLSRASIFALLTFFDELQTYQTNDTWKEKSRF